MDEKDYKAIAEIIGKNYNVFPMDKLIFDLADYFKKESGTWVSGTGKTGKCFDKRQFLKDCGVEE